MTEDDTQSQPDEKEGVIAQVASVNVRRKKIAVIILAAIFVFGLAIVLVFQMRQLDGDNTTGLTNTTLNENVNVAVLPKKVQRTIDGVLVERGKENFLPVAIMIENAAFGGVRPQSGLQEANVVYETLAEGGITRFMAIYASGEPLERIGPVRSARPYYVDWAKEYAGVYMHAGGSPQALQKIATSSEFLDINQIAGQQAYFFRDPKAQSSEHGLFTTSELIGYALRDKNLSDKNATFVPWKFQEKGLAKDLRPTTERKIVIPFSTASYEVVYMYDQEKNAYMRFHGKTPHIDALTGNQIEVKNIIVQYANTGILESSSGRLRITTVGEGEAIVFYNGTTHKARWKKESESGRTIFTDLTGNEIEYIPGNIWVEVVPSDRVVQYTEESV